MVTAILMLSADPSLIFKVMGLVALGLLPLFSLFPLNPSQKENAPAESLTVFFYSKKTVFLPVCSSPG